MHNFARTQKHELSIYRIMAEPKRADPMPFEGNDFIQDCLDAFDANITQTEKEYADVRHNKI